MKPTALVACEYSGKVRRALEAKGYEVTSVDFEPPEDAATNHRQEDVRPWLRKRWDLVVAHPTCTNLTLAGVRWLYLDGRKVNGEDPARWAAMRRDCEFFAECWNANSDCVVVENSQMHGYAKAYLRELGVPVDDSYKVQQWMFADGYARNKKGLVLDNVTKGCVLLSRGLPKLIPTSILNGSSARPEAHFASPGPDRWKERSRTRDAIAGAIADQLGIHTEGETQ